MDFRYTEEERQSKIFFRQFFPTQKSSYTKGEVKDICSINLVPPEDLKKFFTGCIQLLQDVKKTNEIGDYLEFGVFNGASLSSMYLTAKKLGLSSIKCYGFDSFEGLPPGAEKEDDGTWEKGFYSCSYEQLEICLRQKDIDPNDITWIKGWYQTTLNEETKNKIGLKKIGVVFIDCDTYSSSKAVLDFIGPLLTEPAILCFDDWKLYDLDVKGLGEYKSFNEFLDNHPGLKATEIPSYNRKSKSFLVEPLNNH